MRITTTTAALLTGAVLAAGSAVPAHAGGPTKPKVDLRGATVGSYVLDEAGSAHLTGTLTGTLGGKAFEGPYTAVLTADDGSLPAPGVCEPATATVSATAPRTKYLDLTAAGEVCGEWTSPQYAVTHKLTGRYVVDASSAKSAVGTDGWIGLILATEGRANVELFDS